MSRKQIDYMVVFASYNDDALKTMNAVVDEVKSVLAKSEGWETAGGIMFDANGKGLILMQAMAKFTEQS